MKNRLREVRQRKGLTLKEASEGLNKIGLSITADALSKYERGDREPKLKTWSKLAQFYDVPLFYLQSAPTSKETIEATRKIIVDVLNNYYFESDVKNSFLGSRLENESVSLSLKLQECVIELVKKENIKDIPIQIKKKKNDSTKNINNFWFNNFAFLFNENSLAFRKAKWIVDTKNTNTYSINELVKVIISSINDYLVKKFESDFGYYYKHVYKNIMNSEYGSFEHKLLTSNNKKDIEASFKQYIDILNSYKDSFIESLEDGSVKQASKRRKASKEVGPFLADWVNHFNSDDEFKKFIRSKGNDGYRIDLNLLKEYKLKHGEDTTKLNDYLNKFSSK